MAASMRGKTSSLLAIGFLMVLLSMSAIPVYAAHTGITSIVYAMDAQISCPATLQKFDPATDTTTNYALTSTGPSICNGRGLAWDGTDLWYSVVLGTSFTGDGLIHKVGPTGGADLGTIPDPYGAGGRGIGALDFAGGYLWAESYLPVSSMVEITKLDPSTGTVLASCNLPFRGGGAGSDTFAIYGSGQFATDGGEALTTVYFYDQPITVAAGDCVETQSVTLAFGVTGLDFDSSNNCVATDLSTIFNRGGSACDTAVSSSPAAFSGAEDLAATTTSTPPPPGHGVPEFPLGTVVMLGVAMIGIILVRTRTTRLRPAVPTT
jgi:hypothetical protein